MVFAYSVYRHISKDVFVLAGGVLSAIITITVALAKALLEHNNDGGAFLFIALVVIGLSAAGGVWLQSVVNEERT
jgi:hypothetical protein